VFQKRINRLINDGSPDILQGGLKGVEKESLRVSPDGFLSQDPHPAALGSALTNRFITTDFSEALLEFVTPASVNTWETLRMLCDLHQFSYARMGDELLWVNSMPCQIPPDREIPLAQFGKSNVGRMKTIYRNGLGYRYGRNMQAIAGVHFNYSLPEHFWTQYQDLEGIPGDIDAFRSSRYLDLVRNFRRFGWLVLYLFGASPAICKSFARGSELNMLTLDGDSYYEPFGTSLRMSDLGYTNDNQARIRISLNDLDEYISDLSKAIKTPEPDYEKIGTKVDGEYRQLNVNQLQIENEYYSAIRPKRVARSGERPTAALRRGGIEYVEIRSLDINVFDPVGINQNAMRFMEAFLIYCLLEESPPLDEAGSLEAVWNHTQTAVRGRDPKLELRRNGAGILLRDWANEIVAHVSKVAEQIDRGDSERSYSQAVGQQAELIKDPAATPSARVLQELDEGGTGFFNFAMAAAQSHKEYFASLQPLQGDRLALFETEARESIERQQQIEASDNISLDEYLANYFASD
jgi:glutamate--cysteine ligase